MKKRLRWGDRQENWDRDWDNDEFGLMPTRIELEIRNNVDWKQPFQLSDFNLSTNQRTPHDLTGASLRMDLMQLLFPSGGGQPTPGTTPVLILSTDNGTIVIDPIAPSTGAFSFNVPAVTMWAIPAGNYIGDCLVWGTDGSILPAMSLSLEVIAGETPPYVTLSAIQLTVASPVVTAP